MTILLLAEIFLVLLVGGLALAQRLDQSRQKILAQARRIARTAGEEGAAGEEDPPSPFRERIVRPLLDRAGHLLLRFTPQGIRERMALRLVRAGQPMPLAFFTAIRLLFLAVGILLAPFLFGKPILIPLLLLFLMLLPELWISRRITAREKAFIRGLPDVMDLLSVAAEAGLSFEGGLTRVARKFSPPIGTEFSLVLRDMRLGQTRSEALAALSLRVNVPDIRLFVAAVVQGDEMGVGISRILKIQSDHLRKQRWQRAQERVSQLPVKMVLPMVVFIFPALLIVILGPIMLRFISAF